MKWKPSSRIIDLVATSGDSARRLLYRYGYQLGEGFQDQLSQYQTLEDAQRGGRLRALEKVLTEANGESPVDWAMIGSLVDISLARLDNQVSYIRDRSGQALTGVAINVALVTALLGIRATATSMALQAVPRFADRWWQPVVVFALATVFFIGVAATSSVRELPSPGELLSVLTARAERRRPLLILGALEAVYQDQDRRAWVPALLLFGGGILTFLAVAMCVLILFGVP